MITTEKGESEFLDQVYCAATAPATAALIGCCNAVSL